MQQQKAYIQLLKEDELKFVQQEKEKARKLKEDAQKHAEFIRKQMNKPDPGIERVLHRKYMLGGQMNTEEFAMNKNLLQEIAKKKLEKSPGSNETSPQKF
jgi:hypothetical protein